ncbi:MAG: 4-hydroxy-tetrahydrodipicolinate synthase [Candidatus Parcubacteria bacterium]|nr:4-hydroxy-tetrahydrodipicolinate synthase [Candidatus Parcubacteria bacterium]
MITGTLTALVTPFDENGVIDEQALKNLVIHQVKNGVNGLVPCGTTGESPTLSHDEHNKLIDLVIAAVDGHIPVIAGTGSNSTTEAIAMTKHAKKAGASCSLQVVPYYNKPTQEGMYRHFSLIADAVDLPMLIYNIAGRTGINMDTSTLMRLAEHPNVVGVKEASGNLAQMMDVLAQRPKGFSVLSGDDNLTVPLIFMGGNGVISVASNIIPDQIVKMVNAALAGEIGKANEWHYHLLQFFKAIFIETNPIPVKTSLAMMGQIKESFRLPMCEMLPENKVKLQKVLRTYGCL